MSHARRSDGRRDETRECDEDNRDELVGRIVRFLVDTGCEAAAAMVEIEFGRPPSE